MKAPLNIHPPKNWQDFETLCLKLWGEIWNVPHEIEFNSDNSQGQNGVDIYAPFENGTKYNGIQCKNRKLNLIDGSPNRITVSDIQSEIDKALNFLPKLNKLVIATSLPKDQKVEEFVRTKSVENVEKGLFSIQICFWEFFERKIVEFPGVYNWYIKNEDFLSDRKVKVTFQGGEKEITKHPKFQKTIKKYIRKENNYADFLEHTDRIKLPKENDRIRSLNDLMKDKDFRLATDFRIKWEQYCWMKLVIKNVGKSVIENFKLELEFEGDFQEVGAESKNYIISPHFTNTVKEYSNSKDSLYVMPKNTLLVQDDYFTSGNFYIKPIVSGKPNVILLNWKILSKDYTDSGTLTIYIEPKFHVVVIEKEIGNEMEEREEISFHLIERRGMQQFSGINFMDKESDYTFE